MTESVGAHRSTAPGGRAAADGHSDAGRREAPGTGTMVLMGAMMAGANAADSITASVLPITARHFTDNLFLIGAMLAMSRVSGFLVQPYAAWRSDRHWSAGGRRRPFLLAGWPGTLAGILSIAALPYLVPPEYHRTVAVVALLFVLNAALQVSVDVCYGSGFALYGDVFPTAKLGRASAVRTVAKNATLVAMMLVAVPLADREEFLPYLVAAACVAVSWLIAYSGLRESAPPRLAPRVRYQPLLPLAELRRPHTRHVALVAGAVTTVLAVTEIFHALFVIETLGLSKTALGWSTAAGLVAGMLLAYPAGLFADRHGPRVVVMAGMLLLAAADLLLLGWVKDATSLTVAWIGYRIAHVMVQVPIMPLVFYGVPAERHGSVFAGVQMTRAAIAGAAALTAGYIADVSGSYRTCYVMAAIASVAGLWAAFRLLPRGRLDASR